MAAVLQQPASILREPGVEAWGHSMSRRSAEDSTTVQQLLEAACLNFVGYPRLTVDPDKRKRNSSLTLVNAKITSHSTTSYQEYVGTGGFGGRDGGDDDRDRDYDDNETGDSPEVSANREGRRFACHFQRHQGYSPGSPSRVCSRGFRSIQKIKEHLRNSHLVHCCPFCSMTYRSLGNLRDHRAIGEHARLDNDVEAWRNIYRCLFPGEGIPSPYVSEAEDLVSSLIYEPIAPGSQAFRSSKQGLPSISLPTLPVRLGLDITSTPFPTTNFYGWLPDYGTVGSSHMLATSRHASERGTSSASGLECSVCAATDVMDNLAGILEELSSSFTCAISSRTGATGTRAGPAPPSPSSGESSKSGKGTDTGKKPQKTSRRQKNSRGRRRGRGNSPDRPPIDLPPPHGDSPPGLICCYHRENPQEFGISSPNSLHHKCETRRWNLFSDLLKHYWNLHKKYICGECLVIFDTDQERIDHTREKSHCYRCFAAFPKAPDAEGNLHHSDEYSNHRDQGCQSPHLLGSRAKFQWHRCCELIFGHFGQNYDPYFRTMARMQTRAVASVDDESGSSEPSEMSVSRPEDEVRRLQAENIAQSETIASLRRETEEFRASLASAEQRQNSLILAMSNIFQLLGNSSGILPIGPNLQEQMNFWQNQQRDQGLPVAETLTQPLNQPGGNAPTEALINQLASPAPEGFYMEPRTAEQASSNNVGSNNSNTSGNFLTDFPAGPSPEFGDTPMITDWSQIGASAFIDFDPEFMDFNATGQNQGPPVQTEFS